MRSLCCWLLDLGGCTNAISRFVSSKRLSSRPSFLRKRVISCVLIPRND